MNRAEFVEMLTPLVLALRADFDQATWTAYHRALQDVPARWLTAAVDDALRSESPFMPKPGELRALAMHALEQARAKLSPGDCETCDNTRWVEQRDAQHIVRVARCACQRRYLVAVAALGVVTPTVKRIEAGQYQRVDDVEAEAVG